MRRARQRIKCYDHFPSYCDNFFSSPLVSLSRTKKLNPITYSHVILEGLWLIHLIHFEPPLLLTYSLDSFWISSLISNDISHSNLPYFEKELWSQWCLERSESSSVFSLISQNPGWKLRRYNPRNYAYIQRAGPSITVKLLELGKSVLIVASLLVWGASEYTNMKISCSKNIFLGIFHSIDYKNSSIKRG